MMSYVEILIGLACCGLTGLLCVIWYVLFGKPGDVKIIGCRPWGQSSFVAYKCCSGKKEIFDRLFQEVKRESNGQVYVFFYKSPRNAEIPGPQTLYAIGFPVKFTQILSSIRKGFMLFSMERVLLAVQASYPLRDRFSESRAVRRTYPELYKYIKERKLSAHPAIEVYDYLKKEVTFIQPLIRQDRFYVLEACLFK